VNRWLLAVIGAVAGLAIGIGVSLATDVPLAPEIGARRAALSLICLAAC